MTVDVYEPSETDPEGRHDGSEWSWVASTGRRVENGQQSVGICRRSFHSLVTVFLNGLHWVEHSTIALPLVLRSRPGRDRPAEEDTRSQGYVLVRSGSGRPAYHYLPLDFPFPPLTVRVGR